MASNSFLPVGMEESEEDSSRGYFTVDDVDDRAMCCEDEERVSCIEQERHTWEVVYESSSTRVYRVHDDDDRSKKPRQSVAIKTITDASPRESFRLTNEYDILTCRRLAGCRSVRRALERGNVDGRPALTLEWAHGVTLTEWIQRHHTSDTTLSAGVEQEGESVWTGLAQLAHRVASALSDVHGRGVSIHNFSADNIIVATHTDDATGSNRESDGLHHPAVTIIDLDRASIMKSTMSSSSSTNTPPVVPLTDDTEIATDENTDSTVWNASRRTLLGDQTSTSPRQVDVALCSAIDEETADDLLALGRVFYQLFVGEEHPRHDDNNSILVRDASLDNIFDHFDSVPLHHPPTTIAKSRLLPRSIRELLSALLATEGEEWFHRYRSARDVCNDLQHMIDRPFIYLADDEMDRSKKKISLVPDKLYGREEHIHSLVSAFRERFDAAESNERGNEITAYNNNNNNNNIKVEALPPPPSPSMILVYGYSGTGKTTLVQNVKRVLSSHHEECLYFITGKFDRLQRTEPYSAVIAAFTELCDLIVADEDEDYIQAVGDRIVNAIGSEGGVLTNVIPGLQDIIGEQGEVANVSGTEAQNRFRFVFREFARAVSTSSRPVILFLDDLQWADRGSLDVMEALVTDSNNAASFTCIGGYRDNEVVHSAHPLATTMRSIESKDVAVTRIEVGELSEETINEVISDCLRMPPRLTRSLTEVVFRKTRGNIFFVIQLLQSLRNRGLLYFDDDVLAWRWDEDKIRVEKASDNVVELMTDKIQMLNSDMRNILKLAACIGFHFDADVIHTLLEFHKIEKKSLTLPSKKRHSDILDKIDDDCTIYDLLHHAVAEGLVDKVHHSTGNRFNFSHDKIYEAAYSLIPEDERRFLHLSIGENLLLSLTKSEFDKNLFIVVDQLNLGKQCMEEGEEKNQLELARLNLRAGQKAIASAAFLPAAEYLDTSLSLMEGKYWNSNYELSLEVYSLMVENLYCIGMLDRLDHILNEIFTHARTLQDKMRAHATQIQSLGTRGNIQDAIDTGLHVLAELGEVFPTKISKFTVAMDLMKTRLCLRGKSNDDLYALPTMNDNPTKRAAMKVLSSIIFYTYSGRPEFFPLLSFRMVRLSLRYGICKESVVGFAIYGPMLCGGLGDFRGGYRFGQLAMSLLQRLDARELVAHVHTVLCSSVFHWTESFQTTLAYALQGYRVGMETGGVEYAMLGIHVYCAYSFQSGMPLTTVEALMKMYSEQMQEYNQLAALAITLPPYQCVLNLMGKSDIPYILTGDVMDQEETLTAAIHEQNALIPCFINVFQLFLAYLFGQYDLAVIAADNARNVVQVAPGRYEIVFYSLFDGLTCIEMFRRTKRKSWKAKALKAIKSMTRHARFTPINCWHKLLLMKGELASLEGIHKSRDAEKLFEAAIRCARDEGFLHEEALAYERAGLFLYRCNETERAHQYLTHAIRCYTNWGATAKANQLSLQYFAHGTRTKLHL